MAAAICCCIPERLNVEYNLTEDTLQNNRPVLDRLGSQFMFTSAH